MAITKITKHNKCPVEVVINNSGSPHYAYLKCKRHNKHIQWLSKRDAEQLGEVVTFEHLS